MKVEESCEYSEGLLCRQTFCKSTSHLQETPNPAHLCSLTPLLREKSEGSVSEEESCHPRQTTVDADHKQQVKYREGNLQSSICCISSEK